MPVYKPSFARSEAIIHPLLSHTSHPCSYPSGETAEGPKVGAKGGAAKGGKGKGKAGQGGARRKWMMVVDQVVIFFGESVVSDG